MKVIEKLNYSVATEERNFNCIYSNEANISVTENKTSEIIVRSGKLIAFLNGCLVFLLQGYFYYVLVSLLFFCCSLNFAKMDIIQYLIHIE